MKALSKHRRALIFVTQLLQLQAEHLAAVAKLHVVKWAARHEADRLAAQLKSMGGKPHPVLAEANA